MTEEDIKDTKLYKDCYKRISKFPELRGDIAKHLKYAYENYAAGIHGWMWNFELSQAFIWLESPQGEGFWERIYDGNLPREYE